MHSYEYMDSWPSNFWPWQMNHDEHIQNEPLKNNLLYHQLIDGWETPSSSERLSIQKGMETPSSLAPFEPLDSQRLVGW